MFKFVRISYFFKLIDDKEDLTSFLIYNEYNLLDYDCNINKLNFSSDLYLFSEKSKILFSSRLQ